MKIKLEIKSSNAQHPLYTIFMEEEQRKIAKFFFTRFNLRQLEMGQSERSVEKQDVPITDGKMSMDKDQLKEFIASLQCLLKSMNTKK